MRLPNGYGSVHKLSGKRRKPWAVRLTVGTTDEGKQIYKYLGFYTSRPKAIDALAEYNASPYDLSNRELSYTDIYEKYCKYRYIDKDDSIPAPYAAAYARSENLHDMPFVDIRTKHIQYAIDECDKGFSTKKNIRILANLLFKYASANELVDKNYAELTKLPAQQASKKHKPFTKDELATLWQHTADPGVQFALVYCYTGMRPTELLKIKTENVHLDERHMFGGMKTAAGKNRAIPIAEKIYPFIQAWYRPENEYLVIDNKDANPIGTYERLRAHYWERSPILREMDHLPHDGRHTCATLLNDAAVPEVITQKILGHAGKNITQKVYTHKTIKQLVDAINLI